MSNADAHNAFLRRKMRVQLHTVAPFIGTGIAFRSGIKRDPGGNARAVQMKDITRDGRLLTGDLFQIRLGEVNPEHWLRPGDVLFKARGDMNAAAEVPATLSEAVAAAPLMTIRIETNKVLPAYLAWYLNQQPAQRHFAQLATGTYLRQINRDVVEQLEIELPDLETQRRIVEIADLGQAEHRLTMQLAEKQRERITALLMRMAKGSEGR